MSTDITIERAIPDDAYEVAVMVGELLEEIMRAIDKRAFNFYLAETTARLEDFLIRDQYFVYLARAGIGRPAGFIALDECYALYAEGAFGTIPELYIRPEFRGQGLGQRPGIRRRTRLYPARGDHAAAAAVLPARRFRHHRRPQAQGRAVIRAPSRCHPARAGCRAGRRT